MNSFDGAMGRRHPDTDPHHSKRCASCVHLAPTGRSRGGPLTDLAEQFVLQLASATELGLIPDPDAVRAIWEDAVAAPNWTGPALWLHGDLHPANILTADGTFCGVIDFGDLCARDPACDLAAPWISLPDGAADRFHGHLSRRPCAAPAAGRCCAPSAAF